METIIITLDNNKKKEYVKGIKLKEIIEQEKDKLTNTVVGALYNNNMIDYEETLTKNGKLYIYDLNTKEGNKIYEKNTSDDFRIPVGSLFHAIFAGICDRGKR